MKVRKITRVYNENKIYKIGTQWNYTSAGWKQMKFHEYGMKVRKIIRAQDSSFTRIITGFIFYSYNYTSTGWN